MPSPVVPLPRRGDAVVVDLHGELDLFSTPELERRLREADSAPSVVIDLSDVTFLDLAAARTLLRWATPRDAAVVGVSPLARRLFALIDPGQQRTG